MKNKNNLIFTGLTLLCGGIAAVLRVRLLSTGLDEKGLLAAGDPCSVALWVLTVGFLAVLALGMRKLTPGKEHSDIFPACWLRGSLSVAGGLLMLLVSIRLIPADRLAGIMGSLAGFSMAAAGLLRFGGKRPYPLFHTVVCAFYIVRLILSFRGWGADPQLQDYVLQLLAVVCLMLFAFHRARSDANLIERRVTAFWGLAAVYFCVASVSDEVMPLMYVASGLWALGAGGTLEALPEENRG